VIKQQFGYSAAMADRELSGNGASEPGRIPGQRSRHCGAPESDVEWVPATATTTADACVEEIDYVELDEAFVRAARVREASAETRWLESVFQREPARARTPAPGVSWTVRPARHLRALRPSSMWLLAGLVTLTASLLVSLGTVH
jgi:hypothetical protein